MAVAKGETPAHAVDAAGVVRPAIADQARPYLAHRRVIGSDGRERALGGPTAPSADKLLYDAASRFDKVGPYVLLLQSGPTVFQARVANAMALAGLH